MIKCAVCGSENEAAAQFCGTCGSPLSPAEATAIAGDAAKTTISETAEPDEAVVPGKDRGARRDLGTGGETTVVPDVTKVTPEPEIITDTDMAPGMPTITCGVCGTINDATRTYCRKCANELKAAPPPPPSVPEPVVPRRVSPVAVGLGAAAVVVAIALVSVLLLGGDPAATVAPSTAASPGASVPIVGPTAEATVEPTVPSPTARTFSESDLSGLVAFTRCPAGGGSCSIYVREADSSAKARRIVGSSTGNAQDPTLSPDRKKIVYVVSAGLRIATVSTRTFVNQSTSAGDKNPFYSWNGKQLTFAGHRSVDNSGDDLEIRIDGLAKSSTSRAVTLNDIVDHDPVFTPDDKSIVYVAGEGDERELKLVDVASGEIKDLTTDAFADEDPAVSPDGTEVVYASRRGADGAEFDLYILNLVTLEITPLVTMAGDEHDPSWSPGGRYIVFSGGKKGSEDLLILDLADMSISALTSTADRDLSPSWR